MYFGIDEKSVIKTVFEAPSMSEARKIYPQLRIYKFEPYRYVVTTPELMEKGQWLFLETCFKSSTSGIFYFRSRKHRYDDRSHDVSCILSWDTVSAGSIKNVNNEEQFYIVDEDSQFILRRDYQKTIWKEPKRSSTKKYMPAKQYGRLNGAAVDFKSYQTGVNEKGQSVYGTKIETLV